MLTWPHKLTDWHDSLAEVEPVFLNIALEIAKREPVVISCDSSATAAKITSRLLELGASADRLFLPVAPSNDTWARDHGPLGVVTGSTVQLQDFRFNGWGNKYPAALDDKLVQTLASKGWFGQTALNVFDLVLEGGSVDCDGAGTLLTTSACLLHPQRNPALSRCDLEGELGDILGIRRFLWLEHGCLEGDDTDSHIDMLARFVDSETIVYQSCDEVGYSCYESLKAMEQELHSFRTTTGHHYSLVQLPWPQPRLDVRGNRLPASYANFLIINDAVLVPTYCDPSDEVALTCLRNCFPDREVIGIDCLPLIQQYGSLHCLTMQLPAGIDLRRPVSLLE